KSQLFSTPPDNHPPLHIHLLQAHPPISPHNKTLPPFQLTHLPPPPPAIPQIKLTFHIHPNRILNLRAKHLPTSKDQPITIQSSSP
ncbi:Hsp70 family protein, partial [Bacillus mycoides]|uniref:Hsp70 family protein n=1 Tax=Bacillus mycoides TaxID=1405 RepID=UPI0011A8EE45